MDVKQSVEVVERAGPERFGVDFTELNRRKKFVEECEREVEVSDERQMIIQVRFSSLSGKERERERKRGGEHKVDDVEVEKANHRQMPPLSCLEKPPYLTTATGTDSCVYFDRAEREWQRRIHFVGHG